MKFLKRNVRCVFAAAAVTMLALMMCSCHRSPDAESEPSQVPESTAPIGSTAPEMTEDPHIFIPNVTEEILPTEASVPSAPVTEPPAETTTRPENEGDTTAPAASEPAKTPDESTEATEESTEAPEVPAEAPEETTEPEIFDPSVPEDTRPPIIVEPPKETLPETDYETYNRMSEAEQKAFYDSFPSADAFFDWYNRAKEEYDSTHVDVTIDGSTNIEIKP